MESEQRYPVANITSEPLPRFDVSRLAHQGYTIAILGGRRSGRTTYAQYLCEVCAGHSGPIDVYAYELCLSEWRLFLEEHDARRDMLRNISMRQFMAAWCERAGSQSPLQQLPQHMGQEVCRTIIESVNPREAHTIDCSKPIDIVVLTDPIGDLGSGVVVFEEVSPEAQRYCMDHRCNKTQSQPTTCIATDLLYKPPQLLCYGGCGYARTADYIFLLGTCTNQRETYECSGFSLVRALYPSFEMFEQVFTSCTSNYGAMVLDMRERRAYRFDIHEAWLVQRRMRNIREFFRTHTKNCKATKSPRCW